MLKLVVTFYVRGLLVCYLTVFQNVFTIIYFHVCLSSSHDGNTLCVHLLIAANQSQHDGDKNNSNPIIKQLPNMLCLTI